jgi:DNA gyrase subunit A
MSGNGDFIDNKEMGRIIPVDIEAEMKQSFIDYAMSVIVDRALPDVRDGLKPVHRRILYAMNLLGFTPDKSYRKCATTVGEVLGKFHPHGDAAVYDSLVRMAQDFSLRYPLIDGHGNFGSIDGDPPAAMRYTEARLTKISMEMLREINKGTVDFKPNFDEHEIEPVVLPSRFPNLLVNGSSGIAVGMTTNIPPHNLAETIDGIIKYIDNPDITIEELNEVIKAPDFPTGGIIIGKSGVREIYKTGRGRIVVRAVTEIETYGNNRHRIIVTELPYQVNKSRLIEKIANLVKDKRIEGISDLRDESDRNGMRIVIEIKRDANPNIVLNQLYVNTQLQDSFNANMLAIVPTKDGKFEPKVLNLKQCIYHYVLHQEDVISRRTQYDLEKAEARAHILEGLKIALDNLDEVINIIRNSRTEVLAKERLSERFQLSDKQSQAIVDMRLGRLTGLEREKLEEEYRNLLERIQYYKQVLSNPELVHKIIKEELIQIKEKYSDSRRTKIAMDETDIEMEDLIKDEDVVITLTHFGYIKRTSIDAYRSQKRGGKGVAGLQTRENDFVEDIFITSTHRYLMFFTDKGRVYKLRAWEIPEAGRQARGTAIVNLLQLDRDEKINTIIKLHGDEKNMYIFMATRKGMVKKTPISQYEHIRKGGILAINLKEGDELIGTRITDGSYDIILVTRKGMSIRFREKDVRPMGRNSMGVIGIRLDEDDEVISMVPYFPNTTLLVATVNGFGKRTDLDEYKVQTRGGKGVLTYRVTEKTGELVGALSASEDDDIMLISTDGTIIRMHVDEVSILSRVTQGVTLMRTSEDNKVVSLTRISSAVKEDEKLDQEDNGETSSNGTETTDQNNNNDNE